MRKFPTYLRIALFILCFGSAGSSWAQTAAGYTYARTTGATYTSVAGTGTNITRSDPDEGSTGGISIGFTCYYCGTAYNTISASATGWVSLANYTAGGLLTNSAASVPGAGFLMPYWK